MAIYGIRKAIQSVEKELNELDYSVDKEEIRKHGSNVFILTENIVKELVYIYAYLLYEENWSKELSKYKNYDKLMFGKALDILREFSKIAKKNKSLLCDLNRNYLVFDINDPMLDKLRSCSKIRGEILHEHGLDINNIKEYKEKVKEGIILSYNALNQLKEKNIFPDIVELDYILSGKEGKTIYFRDEIDSKVPFKILNEDIQDIENKQWYIFRHTNIYNLIPVKNKIDFLNDDTIEPNVICGTIKNKKYKSSFGYLNIMDQEKIEINKPKIFIGRLVTNDIQFENRSISRRHCLIETIDLFVYIVDLDSKFGTYVNNIKLIPKERKLLSDNDEISIGKGIEVVKIRYIR